MRPGKHPFLQEQQDFGTSNLNIIEQWFNKDTNFNLLVHTGKRSSLVVIDVDLRDEGILSFEKIKRLYPEIKKTLTVKTGSGGYHYYFNTSENLSSGCNILGPGIDIRAERGYVIGPYSTHITGKK